MLRRPTVKCINFTAHIFYIAAFFFYKYSIFYFQTELKQVQQENWVLRGGEGGSSACGGAGSLGSSSSVEQQIQMQRFAQELKGAASTAETSLRYVVFLCLWYETEGR